MLKKIVRGECCIEVLEKRSNAAQSLYGKSWKRKNSGEERVREALKKRLVEKCWKRVL